MQAQQDPISPEVMSLAAFNKLDVSSLSSDDDYHTPPLARLSAIRRTSSDHSSARRMRSYILLKEVRQNTVKLWSAEEWKTMSPRSHSCDHISLDEKDFLEQSQREKIIAEATSSGNADHDPEEKSVLEGETRPQQQQQQQQQEEDEEEDEELEENTKYPEEDCESGSSSDLSDSDGVEEVVGFSRSPSPSMQDSDTSIDLCDDPLTTTQPTILVIDEKKTGISWEIPEGKDHESLEPDFPTERRGRSQSVGTCGELPVSLTPKKHQMDVLGEIVQTERDYVRDLNILCSVFLNPIREKKLLNPFETVSLFSNIEGVLQVNQLLLDQLEHFLAKEKSRLEHIAPFKFVVTSWDEVLVDLSDLALIFQKALPSMRPIYSTYCSNQPNIHSRLQDFQSRDDFKAFMERCFRRSECRMQGIESFLIAPLQRLCRYPLLLQELLKVATASASTVEPLKLPELSDHLSAFGSFVSSSIKQLVDEINQKVRHVENASKLLLITSLLTNGAAYRDVLIRPGRYFIYEGMLLIHGKPRHLFLFTDSLLVCKPVSLRLLSSTTDQSASTQRSPARVASRRESSSPFSSPSTGRTVESLFQSRCSPLLPQYTAHRLVYLEKAVVSDREDNEDRKFCFEFGELGKGSKIWQARTRMEKKQWMKHLLETIEAVSSIEMEEKRRSLVVYKKVKKLKAGISSTLPISLGLLSPSSSSSSSSSPSQSSKRQIASPDLSSDFLSPSGLESFSLSPNLSPSGKPTNCRSPSLKKSSEKTLRSPLESDALTHRSLHDQLKKERVEHKAVEDLAANLDRMLIEVSSSRDKLQQELNELKPRRQSQELIDRTDFERKEQAPEPLIYQLNLMLQKAEERIASLELVVETLTQENVRLRLLSRRKKSHSQRSGAEPASLPLTVEEVRDGTKKVGGLDR